MTLPRSGMLATNERDAKDFKWHHGQSYVWGASIIDLHERKGQIDIVGWLFVTFVAIVAAIAVMVVLSQ